jgi:hypothetical protein
MKLPYLNTGLIQNRLLTTFTSRLIENTSKLLSYLEYYSTWVFHFYSNLEPREGLDLIRKIKSSEMDSVMPSDKV